MSPNLPLFSMLLCTLLVCRVALADVWKEVRSAGGCENYQSLTDAQLSLAESLFKKILNGTQTSEKSQRLEWAALGYQLVKVPAAGRGWLGLREAESPCRGQGFYLFRQGGPGRLILQVPHAYHDLYSGEIAAGLVRDSVVIVAWNTARRRFRKGGKKMEADLARRVDSLFVALTRAAAKQFPDGRLVQIHGFDNKRRSTVAGATAAVILSSGSSWVTPFLDSIARCLKPFIEGPVLIYPSEVSELGATRNVHGKMFRRYGNEGFVHIELNRQTRERLKAESSLRVGFAGCLGNTVLP